MPDNDLQKLSPAYRLPASDPDFILSDSMQGVRYLLEFAKADERLRSWGVRTTIVVLGSARIREANGDARGAPAAASMARWYDETRRFGRIARARGRARARRRSARQRHRNGRRSRDHGGGQPRPLRRRRAVDRIQYRQDPFDLTGEKDLLPSRCRATIFAHIRAWPR